jgi:hypothetical protein
VRGNPGITDKSKNPELSSPSGIVMLQLDGDLWVKASVAALACAAGACLPMPAVAAARRSDAAPARNDAAATRTYLRARYDYERVLMSEASAGEVALSVRAGQLAGECPSALTYAPRDADFGGIAEEVGVTLATSYWIGTPTLRAATLRLARELAPLRWSSRALTRLVHAESAEERDDTTIVPPDVCADIAAWKASGYATLPPDAVRFLARVERIGALKFVGFTEESREAIIRRLLRRTEGAGERAAARRLARLETRVDARAEGDEVAARKKLAAALGVSIL